MKGSSQLGDQAGWLAEVRRRKYSIAQEHQASCERLKQALINHERVLAEGMFRVCLKWNELDQYVGEWLEAMDQPSINTMVVDAWFLQDLIRYLTPGPDEEIAHVTGSRIGPVRVLSRLCAMKTETKSVVYARSTAQSCADTEIEILEHGNLLHAMAHSHPGRGARATCPSLIDTRYLGSIQRAGSEAIGIIVTRDGWVRFFTVVKPFRVFVMGSGVTQKEEYVYQVTLTD